MERVLVTGGTGFVGRATVRALLDAGFAVRVLTRGPWPFETHPRLERANGSMANERSLQDAAHGCTAVVHLAARKNDERDSEAVNVEGTRMLCAAAKKAGAKRVVYVSTQSAALRRRGLYGETKLRGEGAMKTSGVPFVILRPSLVYGGPGSGVFAVIEKLCNLPFVPVFGDGSGTFRPLHVDDLATAIARSLRADGAVGKTLDIGGPDEVTFDGLINGVQAANGVERPLVHLPVWLGLLGASALRALPHPPVTRSNVLGGLEALPMDTATANAILDIAPRPFAIPRGTRDRKKEAAALLLRYASGGAVPPVPSLVERFLAACAIHGIEIRTPPGRFLLPYVDAASRLWAPRCALRTALLVAAAVAETTPDGARFALPRKRHPLVLLVRLGLLALLSAWFLAIGSVLWLLPSVRRHAS